MTTFARGARIRPGSATGATSAAEGEADLLPNEGDDHDYFGTVFIRGREYRVRLWNKRYPNGTGWLLMKLTPSTRHYEAPP
jgi:hypothetical protein